ncbi:MAG: diguanylate cyclase [Woeseia sp.]|nr:diguanylate cyclase [Woeseia sp.]MBT8096701.1 diguanylate cyclase [Woeseia sp.]NNE59377.1 diguanylate cyclase [Woeseia sp.]
MVDQLASILPATFGVTGLLYLWLAARVQSKSGETANHAIALFLFLVGAMILGSALTYNTQDLTLYSIGRVLSLAGGGFVPVAVYYVYRDYTFGPPTRAFLAMLCAIPVATTLMALTNPLHEILWSVNGVPGGLQFTDARQHGWFRFVHAPFAYGLFTYSIIALTARLRDIATAHRRNVLLFMLAAVMPLAVSFGNTILRLGPYDFPFTSITLTALLPFYWYLCLGLRVYDFSPLTYHTLLNHLHDPIIVLNKSQRILAVNSAAQTLLERPERELIGRHLWNDVPEAQVLREHAASTDLSQTVRMQRDQFYEIYTSRLIGPNGSEQGILLACRDVTKRKLAQKALADSEHLIRSLVENSSNGILRFALENDDETNEIVRFRCTFANRAAEKFLRTDGVTLVGMPLDKIELLDPSRLLDRFMGSSATNSRVNYETSIELEESECWLRVVGEPVGEDISVTLIDITARKRNENKILRDSLRDPLTGVLNRRGFEKEGIDSISRTTRGAVLYLDLNQFKTINDRFGHQAGDALLKAFGHRLEYCLRPEDLLARLGGDEFSIILPDVDIEDVKHVATRLVETGSEPYIIQGQEITCTASVGIALIPQHGDTLWELVSVADRAMYNVKSMSQSASNDCAAYVDAAIAS